MRVIAGTAGGRRLESPGSETRPMTDRVKESLFSILGSEVEGARVLDLYGGSGSLSCEALSRGAASAILVERDRGSASVARANLDACGFANHSEIYEVDVRAFLDRLPKKAGMFELVFVDPPYALSDNAICRVLETLRDQVTPNATVILHRPAATQGEHRRWKWPNGYRCRDERTYGGTALHLASRNGGEEAD